MIIALDQVDMFDESPASEGRIETQRPFKILVSLLDKWEIGYALTDILALDTLRALKIKLEVGEEDVRVGGRSSRKGRH